MGIPVGGSKKDRQTKLKNRMKGDLAYHVLSDKEKREGYDVYEEKYGKKAMDKWRDKLKKTGSVTKADKAQGDFAEHIQKHEGIEMTTYKKGGKVKRKNTSRENRLEELGRVDSEKAYSRKGKRNLKSEKKRIVRELHSHGGSVGSRGVAKAGFGIEIK